MPTASTTPQPLSLLGKYGMKNPSLENLATLQNGGGNNSGSMTVPQFDLPDWLSTDPDSILDELMNEYKGSGNYFNTQGINRSYNQSINNAMGMGGQIADNAVREGLARSGQEGGSVNTSMLKAQAMLPVYEHTSGLRKDKALAIADVKAREAQMRGQLASTLGQMRSSYLGMLAQTYMQGRGMNMQWQGQQFNQALALEELAARRGNVGGGAGGRSIGGGVGGGTHPAFSGQISRAPNNSGMGGVEYTPEYLQYLQATGQDTLHGVTAPPQYPGGGGTGFGNANDLYNQQWRDILSQSTGGAIAPYNMPGMDSLNAQYMNQYGPAMNNPDYDPMTKRYKGKPVVRVVPGPSPQSAH